MSAAYIAGIGEHLPNAAMTFDKFHVAAKLGEAMDAMRRDEAASRRELSRTRWLWRRTDQTCRPTSRSSCTGSPAPRPGWLPRGRCAGARTTRPATISSTTTPRSPAALMLRHETLTAATAEGIRGHGGTELGRHPHLACQPAVHGLLEGITPSCRPRRPRPRLPQQDNIIIMIYLTAAKLPLPTVANPRPCTHPPHTDPAPSQPIHASLTNMNCLCTTFIPTGRIGFPR